MYHLAGEQKYHTGRVLNLDGNKKTRKELILDLLRRNLNAWIGGDELMQPSSGGGRFGARIEELRKDGWEIEARRHPDPKRAIWQYRLVADKVKHAGWECSGCGAMTESIPESVIKGSISEKMVLYGCAKCKKNASVWVPRSATK